MNKLINKKSLLFVSILIMLIMLASCAAGNLPSDSKETTQSTDTDINIDKNITINGIDIDKYVIVYSECDLDFNLNAAEYVRDSIKSAIGTELEIKLDTETAESEHEILIGYTNRTASVEIAKTELSSHQFVITAKESKIVLYGREFAVAGAAYELGKSISESDSVSVSDSIEPKSPEYQDPDNFILFICSGVGENSLKYGEALYEKRIYTNIEKTIYPYNNLVDNLPNQGECYNRPYDVNHWTDSAAAATALATGYKTYNGIVGINKYLQPVKNLTELASELGKSTAILTTNSAYSPIASAFSAHAYGTSSTTDIDKILVQQQTGCLDVLISDIRTPEIYIPNALSVLSESDNGFFIMYEESRIDKGTCFPANAKIFYSGYSDAMTALRIFEEYIMYHPNTVLIFTSDRESGNLTLNNAGLYKIEEGEHSLVNVPLAAIGKGTEVINGKTCDNTFVAKLIARLMGEENFGDPDMPETVEFSEAQPYTAEEKNEINTTYVNNAGNYSAIVSAQENADLIDREQRREEYLKKVLS